MPSEEARVVKEAPNGATMEVWATTAFRGPDGGFISPDEFWQQFAPAGYGTGGYGARGYGQ